MSAKYFPACVFAVGALILAFVFNKPGDQLVLAAIGGNFIGLSLVVGFYEYLLRRK